MSSYALSLLLAVIACVIGGALGGIALVRPVQGLGMVGLAEGEAAPIPRLAEGRAFGGLLVLSHAGAALYLGYQPGIGAAMAFALGLAWFGVALGRAASLLIDKAGGRFNLGNLVFEVLIGATLALPFLNPGRLVLRGGMIA
ncbi:DUF4345 family protein [Caulobacter sp. ErkDOM-YI]|uniref:DUF4345 family protein n=1 Tax=unclassified Caulobacter TaxID=2648921 RepID=UPI003AF957D5